MNNKIIKDHSVSKKEFEILYDSEKDLYKTIFNDWTQLDKYYQSEKYISHTDSKKTWFDKTYQLIKKITIKNKWQLIKKYQQHKNISVLDVGCGTGDFLKFGLKEGYKVVGVEPNDQARKLANEKLLTVKKELSEISKQQFDVITLWHVLEHVPDYNDYINQLKSLLKSNGILIIAVPNFKSYDATYYKKYWAAWDVPRHLWHFSKNTMWNISNRHQLALIHIKPMYFDSFYVSMLSEEYKNSRKNILKAFWIGLWSNSKGLYTKEYSSHIYIFKK